MTTRVLIYLFSLSLLLLSCKDDKSYLYDVNPVDIVDPVANKGKQKTLEQYISILYANYFQKALSADEMVEIRKVMESIGDKEVAKELIISNFMNRPDVILPKNDDMRADLDGFLTDTYKRFLVRAPTEAEREWMKNYIHSNPDITPELVYISFALSEEYQFY